MSILDRFRSKTATPQAVKPSSVKKGEPVPSSFGSVKGSAKPPTQADEILKVKPAGGNDLSARTLIKPRVSEKAARHADKGTYVFDVALTAEKIAIKKSVEALYKVKVASVRTMRQSGKMVSRGKIHGQRKDTKKALVTLVKGQTLNLYEGV